MSSREGIFLSMAVRNVRLHWFRSLLAAAGIFIGVIAIASLAIMGISISMLFSGLVTDVGDTIIITPHIAASSGDPFDPRNMLTSEITERQIRTIEQAVGTYQVIPMISDAGLLDTSDGGGYVTLYALRRDDIPELLVLEEGVYQRSAASGCLIGALLADEYDLKVGSRITLDNESIRVTGVVEERGMALDINPDYAIILTEAAYRSYGGRGEVSQVVVKTGDPLLTGPVKVSIDEAVNRREEIVDITDSRELLELFYETNDAISFFLLGMGAVALFVSGVSILNVMIISVDERTQEIGVMRSIGTRRGEVLRLFIYEALILGGAGSLAGGGVSAAIGSYISKAAWEALFGGLAAPSWTFLPPGGLLQLVFSMAFGVAVSLIAGAWPAWMAAQKNPVEALRYE